MSKTFKYCQGYETYQVNAEENSYSYMHYSQAAKLLTEQSARLEKLEAAVSKVQEYLSIVGTHNFKDAIPVWETAKQLILDCQKKTPEQVTQEYHEAAVALAEQTVKWGGPGDTCMKENYRKAKASYEGLV